MKTKWYLTILGVASVILVTWNILNSWRGQQIWATKTSTENDIEDQFYFLPKRLTDCDDLFKSRRGKAFKYPASYDSMKRDFLAHLQLVLKKNKIKRLTDGHTGNYEVQAKTNYVLANSSSTKTVCETGFNAGHSTLQWLTGSTTATVYSFDYGSHVYGKSMASYLQSKFPGRLHMIWGNSFKTVPAFIRKNPDVRCDLIVVDGGHSYKNAYADLSNMRTLAKLGHTIFIVDDVDCRPAIGVKRAWDQFYREWHIEEVFRCNFFTKRQKGFAVGRYFGNRTRGITSHAV